MNSYIGPSNKVEVLDNIFIADKGSIKILLLKKETEPYKGYWFLPHSILLNDECVSECASKILQSFVGVELSFEENAVFSDIDRISDERVIGISCIGLIDNITFSLKQEETTLEHHWFEINSLPKMIYDHAKIANKAIQDLKNILRKINMVKKLFPSDFTLSELQKIYEQLLQSKLDRRNFRKKLAALNVLEPTGEKNIGESGRPAQLYRFKEDLQDQEIY
jgi:ADP-ribose pyrophosphatase YjhB (NUDIX family)